MSRLLHSLLALMALAVALALTAGASRAETKPPADPASMPRSALRQAKSWGYQLTELVFADLNRSPYDVLVVDPGSGNGSWGLKATEIARLKRKPDGTRRVVLAYINIGEAEDYRAYWRKAWTTKPPAWLGAGNARWQGDHRVRHWHPEWRALVFGSRQSMVGHAIAMGFDGVYMDRVDIWQFWCGERPSTFEDMVAFVTDISGWAKAQKPGFLIVPQNAEEMLQSPAYRAVIDGIGKEDFLFGDRGNDVANYETRIERAEMLLRLARADGLPVLAVEYTRDPANQTRAREHHGRLGSVLYFGPRSLAYLGQAGKPRPNDRDSEPYHAARGPLGCNAE